MKEAHVVSLEKPMQTNALAEHLWSAIDLQTPAWRVALILL